MRQSRKQLEVEIAAQKRIINNILSKYTEVIIYGLDTMVEVKYLINRLKENKFYQVVVEYSEYNDGNKFDIHLRVFKNPFVESGEQTISVLDSLSIKALEEFKILNNTYRLVLNNPDGDRTFIYEIQKLLNVSDLRNTLTRADN